MTLLNLRLNQLQQDSTSSCSIVLLISNGSVCVYVCDGGILCTNCQFELFTFQAITFVDVLGNV